MTTLKRFLFATCFALGGLAAGAGSLSTAFTYQGRLSVGTNAANGLFDLRFGLYDAATGGAQVGNSLTNVATGVTNGHFAVSLDFGAAFDGNARWLETAVRTNGVATFTLLNPRQQLAAAPYATYAPGAGVAAGVSAGAITTAMLANGAVTTAKIGSAAVKPSNMDDGGSAAYDELMGMARGLVTTEPLPFTGLLLVTTNSGAAPTLTFRLDGSAFGKVLGFTGQEGLSEVYQYVVEVLAPHASLDPESQVGRQGGLYFARNDRTTTFAGVITACSQASYAGDAVLYTFRLEPSLTFLGLSSNYRVYQDQSVPDLASALYSEATSNTLREALSSSYAKRPLTMQFAETDLNFFNRLLEHEGIFYFFEQGETSPTLVLGDALASYLEAPYDEVRYYGNFSTNPHPAEECLRAFQKVTRESTKAAALTGYDLTSPRKNLLVRRDVSRGRGESFEFDAVTTETGQMENLALVRLESQRVSRNLSHGAGNAADLRPGYTFTLVDQGGSGASGDYVVTAVRHAAFRRTTNGVASLYYGNEFQALPAATPYRPARRTPRPVVPACTAVVVGKTGEEIWTDKYGRIKVQFPWDRYGANNEDSSGWIRVATQLAGKGWGTLFVPRIGQEVLVEFVNGDPDQPVITGSFYNGDNVLPYELPANATKSGIKTRSSKAGTGDNYNEIRFEDKKGSEQLYVRAEKNLDREVKNDMTSWVGHDLTSTVDHDVTSTVQHDLMLSVQNNLNIIASRGIGLNTGNDPAIALKVGGTVAATNFQGSGSGLIHLPATNLTGTINDARLSSNVGLLTGSQTFSGAKVFNNAANSFTGNGSGLSAVNADLLDGQHGAYYQNAGNLTGTLADARLSWNVPRLDGSQSFSGNNTFLGRVSIGGAMSLDTLTVYGSARLNDNDLFFRTSGDLNHGLGWYGSGKLFAGLNLDGPVLYGCDGGGLGTACSGQELALRWRSDGNVMIDPTSQNAGTLLPGLTFGSFSGEGISSKRSAGGNQYGLDFYTYGTNRLSITQAGRVGIGTANPGVTLDVSGAIHATGAIRSGSETGAAAPNYPTGSDGLVIRRVSSTSSASNSVVARTDLLTLVRDGTTAGLRLAYPAAPGKQTVSCIGVTTNGTQVVYRNVLNNPASAGSLPLFGDAQKVVHYDISFGNPYNAAHLTRVVLDRYDDGATSDNFLVGTITSTYNQ